MDKTKLYSVSELAREFALTPQALRFYEEKGLLSPHRAGGSRVFDYRDRARLVLILKFRRLGFSLEEVKDYLDRYHPGGRSAAQYRDGLDKVRRRLADLERMRGELDDIIVELKDLEEDAKKRLAACEQGRAEENTSTPTLGES
ncbi:MAG TPA: MerR family DNA-binding transcriptional regulator [Azospirillaceae bacterium]|nr:MerR family DNA-binding transcriptional regulator [Azospirillaceae bacterium]